MRSVRPCTPAERCCVGVERAPLGKAVRADSGATHPSSSVFTFGAATSHRRPPSALSQRRARFGGGDGLRRRASLPPSRLTLGLRSPEIDLLRSRDTDRFRSPDADRLRSLRRGECDAEPSRLTRGLRSPETDRLRSRRRLGDAERLRRASRDRLRSRRRGDGVRRRRGDGDLPRARACVRVGRGSGAHRGLHACTAVGVRAPERACVRAGSSCRPPAQGRAGARPRALRRGGAGARPRGGSALRR